MQLLILGILGIVCLGETVLLIDMYKACKWYEEIIKLCDCELKHQDHKISKLKERLRKNERFFVN